MTGAELMDRLAGAFALTGANVHRGDGPVDPRILRAYDLLAAELDASAGSLADDLNHRLAQVIATGNRYATRIGELEHRIAHAYDVLATVGFSSDGDGYRREDVTRFCADLDEALTAAGPPSAGAQAREEWQQRREAAHRDHRARLRLDATTPGLGSRPEDALA